ncbi:Serrate Rna Effector Molecule-like [Manis pentadactyla]|nr:Serrate Rna Effector Molecule-like [Manis pentadactyla]
MDSSRFTKIRRISEQILRYASTYWNQGYGCQQGYGPGYGGSDYSPHGYYGYGRGYYYRFLGMYNWLLETYNRVGPYEDTAGS